MNLPPSENNRIRVLIADDDRPFLESLWELIDGQPEEGRHAPDRNWEPADLAVGNVVLRCI